MGILEKQAKALAGRLSSSVMWPDAKATVTVQISDKGDQDETRRPDFEEQRKERKMTGRELLQQAFGLTLIVLLLTGCGGAPAESTATSVPPTATPTPVPLTPTPTRIPPTPTPEPTNQYKDEHVTIVFDKTERMQELPEDFEGPPAEEGKEYLVLYLIVKEIRDVHITNMLGSRDNRPTIEVNSGEEYSLVNGRVTGIKFSDPTNITSSSELVEDAQCIFIFEVPAGVQPSLLRMNYTYKLNLEDDESQSVEIEIDLL